MLTRAAAAADVAGLIARGMSTLLLYGATNQAELIKMFKRFDTDGNGNIDVDEWKNGFNELLIPLDKKVFFFER